VVTQGIRLFAIALFVAVLPFLLPRSVVGSANVGAAYALIAISLVLVTGWVGQISLGHAALVGVGGYATGWAAGGAGIPFPLSLPAGALAAGVVAALIGLVSLRVRGLYLAVATLVFNWVASEFLFRQGWVIRHSQIPDRPIGEEGWLPRFDMADRRIFYLVAWAVVVAVAVVAANLRDSKAGRAFFAVRGSEMAAASLGIDVVRIKLVAFALSGAIAGVAGNLIMSDTRALSPDSFGFTTSLFYLAIAVVGGLQSLAGAIAAALLFAGLREIFFRVTALGGLLEVVSGVLLAVTLLVYRGGLAAAGQRLRTLMALRRPSRLDSLHDTQDPKPGRRLRGPRRWKGRRFVRHLASQLANCRARSRSGPAIAPRIDLAAVLYEDPGPEGLSSGPDDQPRSDPSKNGHRPGDHLKLGSGGVRSAPPEPRDQWTPVIEANGVTVRFGGLVAVDAASLTVREGEIVGLIGPNGAGKTTLFNAIAGFNRLATGTIRIFGHDATRMAVHQRARMGVSRTFQAIQLFRELTVFQNLLVATHVEDPTSVIANLLASDQSTKRELEARQRVRDVLMLLDLESIADRQAGDLPFGVLRMVEVARAVVTGSPVMMLDEPASGLDNTETDRLMGILRLIRSIGVSQLLIEHDVRMVTDVSDFIYVLDQGSIIAQGPPKDIQRDPSVIAAYLGEPIEAPVS